MDTYRHFGGIGREARKREEIRKEEKRGEKRRGRGKRIGRERKEWKYRKMEGDRAKVGESGGKGKGDD